MFSSMKRKNTLRNKKFYNNLLILSLFIPITWIGIESWDSGASTAMPRPLTVMLVVVATYFANTVLRGFSEPCVEIDPQLIEDGGKIFVKIVNFDKGYGIDPKVYFEVKDREMRIIKCDGVTPSCFPPKGKKEKHSETLIQVPDAVIDTARGEGNTIKISATYSNRITNFKGFTQENGILPPKHPPIAPPEAEELNSVPALPAQ